MAVKGPRVTNIRDLPPKARLLGRGGTSSVWELASNQNLLLKQYHQQVASLFAASSRRLVEFGMEASGRAREQINWPVSVVLDDEGKFLGTLIPAAGSEYLVELPTGVTKPQALSFFVSKKGPEVLGITPLSESEALDLILDLARTLHELEEVGAVYQDLNPANILVARTPQLKVLLLDADSVYLDSVSTAEQPRMIAREWRDPWLAPGEPPDTAGESHALGQLLLRIAGKSQEQLPLDVQEMIRTSLLPDRSLRPTLAQWVCTLETRAEPKPPSVRSPITDVIGAAMAADLRFGGYDFASKMRFVITCGCLLGAFAGYAIARMLG